MKNILIIAGLGFAPESGGGISRLISFAKYLPEFGWNPIILAKQPSRWAHKDYTLLNSIPKNIKIYHAKNPFEVPFGESRLDKLIKIVFLPELKFFWIASAFPKAKQIIGVNDVSAILTTSPPVVSHILGYLLKKKHNIPWVIDFRDPWTQNEEYYAPSRVHKKIEEHLEYKVVSSADKVVFVTQPHVNDFLEKYPSISNEKVEFLPNGFEPDDFKNIKKSKSNKMFFSYVGSIYDDYDLSFLQVFKDLFDEYPQIKAEIKIVFAGSIARNKLREIKSYQLDEIITIMGYIPHHEVISLLVNSDVLLLSIAAKESFKKVFTSRIFEYLAANTYILATIASDGILANLIREANAGVVIDPSDIAGVKNVIQNLWMLYKSNGGITLNQNNEIINRFNRRILTKKLAEILNEIS